MSSAILTNYPSGRWSGELYIAGEIVLWSWFPIITRYTLSALNPLAAAAWTSLLAGAFFLFYLFIRPVRIPNLRSRIWTDIILGTALVGVGYYLLVFYAATLTSPGNVSLLLNLEVLFALLFLTRRKGEGLSRKEKLGALLMCIGAMIVVRPAELSIAFGDLILICAAALPPIGNIYQKRARLETSAAFILFFRSISSGLVLGAISLALEGALPMPQADLIWGMLALNGILLMGLSKIFWIEAIHRMPIARAAAYGSLVPFLCLAWLTIFFNEPPQWQQLIGGAPLAAGMILLSLRNSIPQDTKQNI